MDFLGYSKHYFIFSGLVALLSIVSIAYFGLQFGIDFTGGSILEVTYEEERPTQEEVREGLAELELGSYTVQTSGDQGMIIRMPSIGPATHEQVMDVLGEGVTEDRFESIGPAIGQELRSSTIWMLLLSSLAIVIYIAMVFRRVRKPLSSWQYSVAAFLPLMHDVLVPVGILAFLGSMYSVEVTIPIVVALLTVFGYSVNNTVVTFDRIRENTMKRAGFDFMDVVNKSIMQTLSRNLNTSITTLVVLLALFMFGADTLRYFALALMIGILAGTYSSLLLGPSFLASWAKRSQYGLDLPDEDEVIESRQPKRSWSI